MPAMAAIDVVGPETARTLFDLLVCVAWADGVIQPEESEAMRAAAISLGLMGVAGGPHDPSQGPTKLEDLAFGALSARDRRVAYVCAAWMVEVDNDVAPEEAALLPKLQAALDIAQDEVVGLREQAQALRAADPPEQSWWRRFDALVVHAVKGVKAP